MRQWTPESSVRAHSFVSFAAPLALNVAARAAGAEIVCARSTTTGELSGSIPASRGLLAPRSFGVRAGVEWRSE
jgi:hypothetical protein